MKQTKTMKCRTTLQKYKELHIGKSMPEGLVESKRDMGDIRES